MSEMLKKLLEFIFPSSVEKRLVDGLTESEVGTLLSLHIVHTDITALSHFKDARVSALIHEAKFYGNDTAQELLGKLLVKYIQRNQYDSRLILIPVPLSRKRLRERGYNQVEHIIDHASKINTEIQKETGVLVRTKDTPPQTSLNREDRLRNVEGVFEVQHPERIHGRDITIVDDVTTTGATLRAAKLALLPHSPASITLVALVH